jgi:hypothetical protein
MDTDKKCRSQHEEDGNGKITACSAKNFIIIPPSLKLDSARRLIFGLPARGGLVIAGRYDATGLCFNPPGGGVRAAAACAARAARRRG